MRTMGFMTSYKRLEKLCGDILHDERKVSAYIDEMTNSPRGAYLVSGWNEDLKRLKHLRWVRNRIVHDPGCTEENMCDSTDAQWVEYFYSRIMNQTDPLALYRKATRPTVQHKPIGQTAARPFYYEPSKTTGDCATLLGLVFVIIVMICAFVAILCKV